MTTPRPRMAEEMETAMMARAAVVTECTTVELAQLEGGRPRLGSAATTRRAPKCGRMAPAATPTAQFEGLAVGLGPVR